MNVDHQMVLPESLESSRSALVTALMTPALAEWPEGAGYVEADQALAITQVLKKPHHERLTNCRICHLFRENLSRNTWAQTSKVGGKWAFLTAWDFTIEYSWEHWRLLNGRQRIALVDHELEHCDRDEKERWVLRDHDLEEFHTIVGRWGAWRPSIAAFGLNLRKHLQLDLELVGTAGGPILGAGPTFPDA